ncbi:hypothetical protein ACLBYD_00145 [Rhodococcus sp. C26F]
MKDHRLEFDAALRQIDPDVETRTPQRRRNKYAITLGALVASAWVGETQQVQIQPASELYEWLGDSGQMVADGDGD